MHRGPRAALVVLAFLSCVGWSVVGGRLLSVPIFVLLVALQLAPRTRHLIWLFCAIWALFMCSTLLPFDVTLRVVSDGPKFVRCCPGTPYSDWQAVQKKDVEGQCRFCNDLVGPNEPTWYLLW